MVALLIVQKYVQYAIMESIKSKKANGVVANILDHLNRWGIYHGGIPIVTVSVKT